MPLTHFSCPNCRSAGPFYILITATVLYTEQGPTTHTGYDYNAGSWCQCANCHRQGIVKQFRKGKEQ
jgi:hypothetical protein